MSEQASYIVIGAGLSGLYTAWRLQQQGIDVTVLEARDHIGGRIRSERPFDDRQGAVDLGPAWIWPAFQPRLKGLLDKLGIPVFRQYTQGEMLYEVDAHNCQRHGGPSSHNQSYRISDGAIALVHHLKAALPAGVIHTSAEVTSIQQEPLEVHVRSGGEKKTFSADRVVLALPPRIAAERMAFTPAMDADILNAWRSLPTWMAGHSKMVFVYEKPFWREQGLSGEVFSRYGPLTEIYDGSPDDEAFYALTSFVGLNAHQRRQVSQEQLQDACMAQLERLFGPEARQIHSILISDWSTEPCTTTDLDLQGVAHHPQYPAHAPRSFWNNRLLLAGTEVAAEHGGYLEGALEASDALLASLDN